MGWREYGNKEGSMDGRNVTFLFFSWRVGDRRDERRGDDYCEGDRGREESMMDAWHGMDEYPDYTYARRSYRLSE